jgi:hypothetical protein
MKKNTPRAQRKKKWEKTIRNVRPLARTERTKRKKSCPQEKAPVDDDKGMHMYLTQILVQHDESRAN